MERYLSQRQWNYSQVGGERLIGEYRLRAGIFPDGICKFRIFKDVKLPDRKYPYWCYSSHSCLITSEGEVLMAGAGWGSTPEEAFESTICELFTEIEKWERCFGRKISATDFYVEIPDNF